LKNASNIKNDEYKTIVLPYSRELDSLILANYIIRSPEEEESSPLHIKNVMTNSKEKIKNILQPF
jgi:hypothetical protein